MIKNSKSKENKYQYMIKFLKKARKKERKKEMWYRNVKIKNINYKKGD